MGVEKGFYAADALVLIDSNVGTTVTLGHCVNLMVRFRVEAFFGRSKDLTFME